MRLDEFTVMYILNDDIAQAQARISALITQLSRLDPPWVEVAAPWGFEETTDFVHDFVHRTHLDIFPSYYPEEFPAWFLDCWISVVYGDKRTKRLDSKVHVMHQQCHTRYVIDPEKKELFKPVLERDSARVNDYIKKKYGATGTLTP
jgi:hypothetical protein